MAVVLRLAGCVLFSVWAALALFVLVREDARNLPVPVLRALLVAVAATGLGALFLWALSAAVGE